MHKHRMTLLENSLDFLKESLEKAIKGENDVFSWKYAISNLIQAIELI